MRFDAMRTVNCVMSTPLYSTPHSDVCSRDLCALVCSAGEACKARGRENLTLCDSLLLTFRSSHLGPATCTCADSSSSSSSASAPETNANAAAAVPTCAAVRSFFYEHPCRTQQTQPEPSSAASGAASASETGGEEADEEPEPTELAVPSCRPLLADCPADRECSPLLERFRANCATCASLRQCAHPLSFTRSHVHTFTRNSHVRVACSPLLLFSCSLFLRARLPQCSCHLICRR